MQTGVGQPLMPRKISYFDQTCNEFISEWVVMACLGPKPIRVLVSVSYDEWRIKTVFIIYS